MDVHVQKCQNCHSRNLRNILAREGEHKVFVQCRDCGEFVARYTIASGGYFHEGRGYESFLRAMMLDSGFTSGRDLKALYEEVVKSSNKGFKKAVASAIEKYGDDLP